VQGRKGLTVLRSREPNKEDTTTTPIDEDYLSQTTKGGYTVKQRLREEVESPFRKVRLMLFGSSAASALLALYFSALATYKAVVAGSCGGYYSDAPSLDEVLPNRGFQYSPQHPHLMLLFDSIIVVRFVADSIVDCFSM
jgi:hypothetical protein